MIVSASSCHAYVQPSSLPDLGVATVKQTGLSTK